MAVAIRHGSPRQRAAGDRLVLSFMGLAFARAWLAILFADPLSKGYGATYGSVLFDVAYVICAFVALAALRRIVPVTARAGAWAVPFCLMEASSIAFILGEAGPMNAHVAHVVSSVAGGAGFLTFCLYNAEVLATQPLRNVMMYLALSPVLGFVLTFFLTDVGLEKTSVALVLLPLIAVGLCVNGLSLVPPQLRPKADFPRFNIPWVLLVLLAAYAFVYGLHQSSLTPGVGRYSSFVNAAVGIVAVAWVAFFSSKVSFRILYGAPVLLMICGFVLVSLHGFIVGFVADVLIAAAFGLATLIISFMFYDMSKRSGVPIVAFSAAYAATNVFGLLGQAASNFMASYPAYGSFVAAITYVAIAALLLLMGYATLADRTLFERWGIRLVEDDAPEMLREAELIERRCHDFAKAHSLTAREEEVLALVAQGLSSREVQDRLFIAEGTFKTHMRHIYEKGGVRGMKRLRQLLGESDEDRSF